MRWHIKNARIKTLHVNKTEDYRPKNQYYTDTNQKKSLYKYYEVTPFASSTDKYIKHTNHNFTKEPIDELTPPSGTAEVTATIDGVTYTVEAVTEGKHWSLSIEDTITKEEL